MMYTDDVYNPKSRLTLYLKWLSIVTLSNESGNHIPDNARLEYEIIILNSPILTKKKMLSLWLQVQNTHYYGLHFSFPLCILGMFCGVLELFAPIQIVKNKLCQTVTNFIFLSSNITVDGECSHEIKRHFLLGRKVMTNLHSILKSRDVTLPAKSV